MSATKVRLLTEDELALTEVFGVDVKKWTDLARWAAVMHDVVVDYLKSEDERLAMTHALAVKKVSREAWMDHGDVADRRRKAIEANMRALLAEIASPGGTDEGK